MVEWESPEQCDEHDFEDYGEEMWRCSDCGLVKLGECVRCRDAEAATIHIKLYTQGVEAPVCLECEADLSPRIGEGAEPFDPTITWRSIE